MVESGAEVKFELHTRDPSQPRCWAEVKFEFRPVFAFWPTPRVVGAPAGVCFASPAGHQKRIGLDSRMYRGTSGNPCPPFCLPCACENLTENHRYTAVSDN